MAIHFQEIFDAFFRNKANSPHFAGLVPLVDIIKITALLVGFRKGML